MEKLYEDDIGVAVKVSRENLGKLGLILDWIVDNYDFMDKDIISLDEDKILLVVNEWLEFLSKDVLIDIDE